MQFQQGDRVQFRARQYVYAGGDSFAPGGIVTLTGTVIRPLWGRGNNISIKTDDGHTYVRFAEDVTIVT